MQARKLIAAIVGAAAFALPTAAFGGHGLKERLLDHPAPSFAPGAPLSSAVNSGGPGAEWELVTTIPTGNPHTDVDFFTSGGETYMSAGTLATGPNGGGQSIVRLTEGGNVSPEFVAGHPSATCVSDPSAVLALQHDVEATPKPTGVPLNATNPSASLSDAQLIVDATDAEGRCHDASGFGLDPASPQGGLEIVDVTDPANPVEIGLTRHIGEAHTVNVDPKRPHIAYAVTSDAVEVRAEGQRDNENPREPGPVPGGPDQANPDRFDLDGFELVDLSSCMNFPAGTTAEAKRAACQPEVYRYRYPNERVALGHTLKTGANAIHGCHELEVYPDDRLTCGSGGALAVFDMKGAFNDMGTPNDFTDDKPVGTPLPCRTAVESESVGTPFATGAKVTDCVDGEGDQPVGGVPPSEDLTIPGWLASGAPSLEGVQWLGSIHHQGRGAGGTVNPTFDSTQDIDFNHEAELSGSGNLLLATDERGGGVTPPGASCAPGGDNVRGNGGVHFYRTDALHTNGPLAPEQEHAAYARTPDGKKAIFRAPIRTKAQATVCTAHVFQQIPGQNRIFMAWYSQGTQVIDFLERPDGTVEFKQAGWFTPENANEWVSAVYNCQQNADGTFTYNGATGDFSLGEAGRNAMDIYRVTLPPAPTVGESSCGGAAEPGGRSAGKRCPNVITGKRKRDKIVGTSFGDTIRAKGGNDRVKAGLGDDCLIDGKGRDVSRGQKGNDLMKPGRGRDKTVGGAGNDRIKVGGGGRDRVRCGAGNDVVKVDRRDRFKGCEKVRGKPKR
jgi:Ca2+-binding RTX toxin-like protein